MTSNEVRSCVYYGVVSPGATGRHRRDALTRVAETLETVPASRPYDGISRFVVRVPRLVGFRPGFAKDNARLVEACVAEQPDLVWLAKPLGIRPHTLESIKTQSPNTTVAVFSPDDYQHRDTSSRNLRGLLALADIVVTTKPYNVQYLKSAGAPEVLVVGETYEPRIHFPRYGVASQERDVPVVFVGRYETRRASSILRLAKADVPVVVYGPGPWNRVSERVPLVDWRASFLADGAYAHALSKAQIGLGFLASYNQDGRTTRSVEIPACGAALVTERTPEHQEMFRDGDDAVFFDDDAELVDRVRRLLADSTERQRIASNGLETIHRGAYSNQAMLEEVLQHIGGLR